VRQGLCLPSNSRVGLLLGAQVSERIERVNNGIARVCESSPCLRRRALVGGPDPHQRIEFVDKDVDWIFAIWIRSIATGVGGSSPVCAQRLLNCVRDSSPWMPFGAILVLLEARTEGLKGCQERFG
jgi:hypothetical protein